MEPSTKSFSRRRVIRKGLRLRPKSGIRQNVRKKWTATTWPQDNTISLTHSTRASLRATSMMTRTINAAQRSVYQTFTLPSTVSCSQPSDTYEYAADATTVLRHSHTDYNLTSTYISATRRIIGLPSAQYLYEGSSTLMSKIDYQYDSGGQFLADQGRPPITTRPATAAASCRARQPLRYSSV